MFATRCAYNDLWVLAHLKCFCWKIQPCPTLKSSHHVADVDLLLYTFLYILHSVCFLNCHIFGCFFMCPLSYDGVISRKECLLLTFLWQKTVNIAICFLFFFNIDSQLQKVTFKCKTSQRRKGSLSLSTNRVLGCNICIASSVCVLFNVSLIMIKDCLDYERRQIISKSCHFLIMLIIVNFRLEF